MISNGQSKQLASILRAPSYMVQRACVQQRFPLSMMTTPQLAKLTGATQQSIYVELARTGRWCDVIPCKLKNGRYLWRVDEIHLTLGLIPDHAELSPGERAFVAFFELECIPLTRENFKVTQSLLSGNVDHGRDPEYYADEVVLIVEIFRAHVWRLEQAIPSMNDRHKQRARTGLQLIASMTEALLKMVSEATDND